MFKKNANSVLYSHGDSIKWVKKNTNDYLPNTENSIVHGVKNSQK